MARNRGLPPLECRKSKKSHLRTQAECHAIPKKVLTCPKWAALAQMSRDPMRNGELRAQIDGPNPNWVESKKTSLGHRNWRGMAKPNGARNDRKASEGDHVIHPVHHKFCPDLFNHSSTRRDSSQSARPNPSPNPMESKTFTPNSLCSQE